MEMSLLSWDLPAPLDSGQLSPMFKVLGWVPKPDELTWMWNQLWVNLTTEVSTSSHRLRSVKMEQRKLSDQANTPGGPFQGEWRNPKTSTQGSQMLAFHLPVQL